MTSPSNPPQIVLTKGQTEAYNAFVSFLADPKKEAFILSGYSGTGKSTLVKTLVSDIPNLMNALKLLNPKSKTYDMVLTATTNKAAENLSFITGEPVSTVYSYLSLRVETDYKTNKTKIKQTNRDPLPSNTLLIVDECSYIDEQLLQIIFSRSKGSKVLFIGDPAQLTLDMSCKVPVFKAGIPEARLTEVVRQASGSPITLLSTLFREAVETGHWGNFTPDNHHVHVLSRADFNTEIQKEFTRPDWSFNDSKILAWTNKTVISYNHKLNALITGTANFKAGDYAICNNFISRDKVRIKTDQMVRIIAISPDIDKGLKGNWFLVDGGYGLADRFFMPDSINEKNALIKQATKDENSGLLIHIDRNWIDLRAAYACTVYKAQGSTFKKAFVDLDDIGKCRHGNQLARLLYVAVSRASDQVYITGDLV